MKRGANWVAASVFFLAGSLLYAVPAMARSVLYAARMTGAYSIPDPTVERLVPERLTNVAFVAYLLCVIALGWPQLEQWINAWFSVPAPSQPKQDSEPPVS